MCFNILYSIFNCLLDYYGPQGWWPVYSLRLSGGRDKRGYLPNPSDYSRRNIIAGLSSRDVFEIAVGAVLTQNTSWKNVEKALENLESAGLLDCRAVMDASATALADAVRPSGYYNQKAKKLKVLARFFSERGNPDNGNPPSREDLLELWGVGKETADSILLYAYGLPFFVVDAYTKRMFKRLGILTGDEEYDEIAAAFTSALGEDPGLFNEYHALIVRHGREHCRKKPLCKGCVLRMNNLCSF